MVVRHEQEASRLPLVVLAFLEATHCLDGHNHRLGIWARDAQDVPHAILREAPRPGVLRAVRYDYRFLGVVFCFVRAILQSFFGGRSCLFLLDDGHDLRDRNLHHRIDLVLQTVAELPVERQCPLPGLHGHVVVLAPHLRGHGHELRRGLADHVVHLGEQALGLLGRPARTHKVAAGELCRADLQQGLGFARSILGVLKELTSLDCAAQSTLHVLLAHEDFGSLLQRPTLAQHVTEVFEGIERFLEVAERLVEQAQPPPNPAHDAQCLASPRLVARILKCVGGLGRTPDRLAELPGIGLNRANQQVRVALATFVPGIFAAVETVPRGPQSRRRVVGLGVRQNQRLPICDLPRICQSIHLLEDFQGLVHDLNGFLRVAAQQ
mmetsp:Transcript_60335/g.153337  ORF Transcript_60335/g.153337 Transcript_60335/m.153337 type:complete len:380 (+) Transcript_60335:621-1760(+)